MRTVGEKIGERVRELRTMLKLSQAEVARRSGIQRPNIARLEAGEHTPSLDVIVRVADAMRIQPSEILKVLDDPSRYPYPVEKLVG